MTGQGSGCEGKVQQVLASPNTDWILAADLKEGKRGDGIHYDWMDGFSAFGIKQAHVTVTFHYLSGHANAQVSRIQYLKEYLKLETEITDPAALSRVRSSLDQAVRDGALQRARIEIPIFTRHAKLEEATGSLNINLFDSECIPPIEDMPDIQDPLETPLMRAITKHDLPAVREQLQKGADVNAKDGQGTTVLMIAAAVSSSGGADGMKIVRLLLDSGARVNERGAGDSTALISSADSGSVQVVRELLARGADVNAAGQGDVTALMVAVHREDFEIVKELIYAGADVCAKSKEGKTALDMVESRGIGRKPDHDAIVAFLKSRMPPK